MPTPLRVLIATDGSEGALTVARCWSAWKADASHPLQALLLAVAPPPPHPFPPPAPEPGRVERTLLEWGSQRLESTRALFAGAAVDWEAQVRIGAPAAAIVDEARRSGAGLIALGTRGVNPLRGLLIGSVALRVAQTSPVPVWLMAPQARPPAELGRRLRLLVAVDGSAESIHAAAWAARIAPRFGDVALDLVSVQPPFSPLSGLLDATAHRFDHWSQRIGEAALGAARKATAATTAAVSSGICTGETVDELCRRADEIDADAIVVGPRGLGAIGQVLLGSVSSGLLQTAGRPVIVVPGSA